MGKNKNKKPKQEVVVKVEPVAVPRKPKSNPKPKIQLKMAPTEVTLGRRQRAAQNMKALTAVGMSKLKTEQVAMLKALTLPGVSPSVRVSIPTSESYAPTALFRFNQEQTLDMAEFFDNSPEYYGQLGHLCGSNRGFIVHAFHDPCNPIMLYRRQVAAVSYGSTGFFNNMVGPNLDLGFGQVANPAQMVGIFPLRPTNFFCSAANQSWPVGVYKDMTTVYVPACSNNAVFVTFSWGAVTNVAAASTDFACDVLVYELGNGLNEEPAVSASAGVYNSSAYTNSLVLKSTSFSSWPYQKDTRIFCFALHINKFKPANASLPITLPNFSITVDVPALSWVPQWITSINSGDLMANADRVRLWGNAFLISPATAPVWTAGFVRAYDLTQIDSPFSIAAPFPESQSSQFRSSPFPWPTGIYGWTSTRSAPILTDYTPDVNAAFQETPAQYNYGKVPICSMSPHDGARYPYGCHRIVISPVVANREVGEPLPYLVVTSQTGEFTTTGQLFELQFPRKESNYSDLVYDIATLPRWTHNPVHVNEFLSAIRRATHWTANKVGTLSKILSLLGVPWAGTVAHTASIVADASAESNMDRNEVGVWKAR